MFGSIFRFELGYQLRNPVFIVTVLIFFPADLWRGHAGRYPDWVGRQYPCEQSLCDCANGPHHVALLYVCDHCFCCQCSGA